MVAILDRLKRAVATKRQQTLGTWREIVEAVQAGREVGENELIEAMEAAGKTIDDLEADIERLTKRKQIAAQLERAQAAAARCEELTTKIADEEAKWNAEARAVAAKWGPIVEALREQRQAAQSQSVGADGYAEQLVALGWPDELDGLQGLNDERLKIGKELSDLQRRVTECKIRLQENCTPEAHAERVEELGPRIEQFESRIGQLNKEQADIDQRIAAIRTGMLEP